MPSHLSQGSAHRWFFSLHHPADQSLKPGILKIIS
jgi:hypothetical protein